MPSELADLLSVRKHREALALQAVGACRAALEQCDDRVRQAQADVQQAQLELSAQESQFAQRLDAGRCDAPSIVLALARLAAQTRGLQAQQSSLGKAQSQQADARNKLQAALAVHVMAQVACEKVAMQQEQAARLHMQAAVRAEDLEIDDVAELLSGRRSIGQPA
jgi:hypothetical protein